MAGNENVAELARVPSRWTVIVDDHEWARIHTNEEDSCDVRYRFAPAASLQTNLHLAIDFPHFIGPDPTRAGAAEDGSGAEVEFGVVPGAGDAAVLDRTEGDRGVGVGTEIIEGVDDTLVPDEGDAMTVELIRTAFAFFEVFGMGDGLEGHFLFFVLRSSFFVLRSSFFVLRSSFQVSSFQFSVFSFQFSVLAELGNGID